MEQNKMTPAPWLSMRSGGTTLVTDESGDNDICEMSITHRIETQNANGSAIVSSVNNTYGAGINPEAVPDILSILKQIMAHFFHEGNNSPKSFELRGKADAAIEKATIK